MAVSENAFREALSHFATGVTVVTSPPLQGGTPVGVTISSFASVSLKPPLILWCLERSADSFLAFVKAEAFAVNVLRAEQEALSVRFSESGSHRFQGIAHGSGTTGAPLLEGVLAQLECRKAAEYDGGDHVIFLGEVLDARTWPGEPLLHFRSAYRGLGPG